MQTISVIDPLTGDVLHDIDSHSARDVALRFHDARLAQREWAKVSPKERSRIAGRIADALIANQDRMMDMLQRETGKSRAHAFEEVTGALGAI